MKERLYVPIRASMPRPGEGPVFGRGFLANLKAGGGRGSFLILLQLLGLGMLLFGAAGMAGTAGPYWEGLQAKGDPRLFFALMVFGAVFFLTALHLFQAQLAAARGSARPQGDPKAPWTWDHPWSTEWMKPDHSGRGAGVVLGRISFLALLALMNLGWGAGSFARLVIGICNLIGLWILYDSCRKVVQWLRVRRPVVIWPRFPFFFGSTLEGRVAFSRNVPALGPARVTLRCVREKWELLNRGTGTATGTQRQLAPYVIWKETREFPLGDGQALLDFRFELPHGQPGTALSDDGPVYWQVEVAVPVAGPDIRVLFLAPVYKRP